MSVVAWVAVGVFVAVIDGSPAVQAVANPEPFKSQTACEEHAKGVRERAAKAAASPDNPLVAFGVTCTKVEVEEPKQS